MLVAGNQASTGKITDGSDLPSADRFIAEADDAPVSGQRNFQGFHMIEEGKRRVSLATFPYHFVFEEKVRGEISRFATRQTPSGIRVETEIDVSSVPLTHSNLFVTARQTMVAVDSSPRLPSAVAKGQRDFLNPAASIPQTHLPAWRRGGTASAGASRIGRRVGRWTRGDRLRNPPRRCSGSNFPLAARG